MPSHCCCAVATAVRSWWQWWECWWIRAEALEQPCSTRDTTDIQTRCICTKVNEPLADALICDPNDLILYFALTAWGNQLFAAAFTHRTNHRGAFEIASTGFTTLCRYLWSSPEHQIVADQKSGWTSFSPPSLTLPHSVNYSPNSKKCWATILCAGKATRTLCS